MISRRRAAGGAFTGIPFTGILFDGFPFTGFFFGEIIGELPEGSFWNDNLNDAWDETLDSRWDKI